MKISNRAVYSLDEFKESKFDDEIDFKAVSKALDIEREKSIDWLLKAIEDEKE